MKKQNQSMLEGTSSEETLSVATASEKANPAEGAAKAPHGGGPKTAAGKLKSAQNARKHGFFAKAMFRPEEVGGSDYQDYTALLLTLTVHYQPWGAVEQILVEKLAAEFLRWRRLLVFEANIFSNREAFMHPGIDKLLRYQATLHRQIFQVLAEIERQQRMRLGDLVPAPVSLDVRIDTSGGKAGLESTEQLTILPANGSYPAPGVHLLSPHETSGKESSESEVGALPVSPERRPSAHLPDHAEEAFCETNLPSLAMPDGALRTEQDECVLRNELSTEREECVLRNELVGKAGRVPVTAASNPERQLNFSSVTAENEPCKDTWEIQQNVSLHDS